MPTPSVRRHRWSRDEYEAMIAAGIFHPEARLELVDGEIVEMTPQGSAHATAIQLIEDALRPAFGAGHAIRIQLPLALDATSEPEPDVAVVTGHPRDYKDAHPDTAVLVVEVAETSLTYDRLTKGSLYARSGIPEYWLLDLGRRQLEVYRRPQGEGFLDTASFSETDRVAPAAVPDAALRVADLLP